MKTEHHAAMPGRSRIAVALLLSSVGAVLFSLSIFRLLSFFVMPSMFIPLLLVGFPIGAAIATRWGDSGVPRLRHALGLLQTAMIASAVVTLLSRHVDYMRANLLFGIDPGQLLLQVLVFAALYLPFFIAYGATEYVGYVAGTRVFGERMRPVYALFLFGAAAAYTVARLFQQPLGVPRLLLVATACLSISRLLLVPPQASKTRSRFELAVLVMLLCWPGFDRFFMEHFKLGADVRMSVNNVLAAPGAELEHSAWGEYGYVEIVRRSDPDSGTEQHFGFYNDIYMWAFQDVRTTMRFLVASLFQPEGGGSVAVLGSGGGRGVVECRESGARRILAIEIEPEVIRAIRRPELRDRFARPYNDASVEVHVGEARSYFERTDERFDLIMLMSVGGYPQLMLEPGNMIRTTEAFALFVDHLRPGGVLAVQYNAILDQEAVLLDQYFRTVQSLGMESYRYRDSRNNELYLLAFRKDASPAQARRWSEARENFQSQLGPQPEWPDRPDFQRIGDDRPYLAGNISNILNEQEIAWMFQRLAVLVSLAGLAAAFFFGRRLMRRTHDLPVAGMLSVGVLIGANFLLIEHMCVIHLFQRIYAYYDALILGTVSVLTVSGMGSLLIAPRALAWLASLSVVSLSVWWFGGAAQWDPGTALVLVTPAVLTSGSFFPLVFERSPAARLELFGMDAIGAAFGAMLAFFVPMLFGFDIFLGVAAGCFAATSIVTLVLLGRSSGTSERGSEAARPGPSA
jgi:spermidine synthase